jgi:hypothetical protein
MEMKITAGDIVLHTAAEAINQTKVRSVNLDGKYVFIDYYEGDKMIHRFNRPVLMNDVSLIAKRSKPLFDNLFN